MNRATLKIHTTETSQVIDITERLNQILAEKKIVRGILSLFLTHTTAALVASALDPKADLDILDALEMIVPAYYSHLHHHAKVPHHIIASFLNTSLLIPVEKGKLLLGPMQRVMLVELNGPKERNIIVEEFKN